MQPRLLPLLLALVAVLGLWGCAPGESADLLNVIDVVPRDVEVGDRIEILGTRLPSGDVSAVSVRFRGTLHRPGQSRAEPVDITVDHARPSPDKVSLVFSEALQARFCGAGDQAAHTTFHGDVTVRYPSAVAGGQPVQGRVLGVTLDFRPPAARRIVLERQTELGRKALAHLGIVLDETPAPSGGSGLLVAAVQPSSPAKQAGLEAGDRLLAFDGVTVMSPIDMIPPSSARAADLTIKRGEAEPFTRQIDVAGFAGASLPSDLFAALLLLGVAVLIVLVFMAPTAGILTWFERRVSGRMQSRIGPNRAGPQGFFIWVADGIKSIMKEDVVPAETDHVLFRLAPYFVFVGVSATFVVMPFGQYLIAADLDIGILFVVAVTSLVAIGLMTGGWASNNKWSLLGGIRAAAQVISYEIPAAIAIVCIVMMTGSLRMQDIILAQGGTALDYGLGAGGWPWHWFVFRNPVTFGLFFLFFTTALAEGNRTPFDLPEAESELVAGYSTEYSGMRYVFFFFAEWANVFVFCGISAALFLGGWQIPGVPPAMQEASLPLQLLGAFVFLLKSWTLIFVAVWIRWTLPRVRIDQLMSLCWKWLVPLSFAAFVLTGLWVLGTSPAAVRSVTGGLGAGAPFIPEAVQTGIAIAMFALWLVLLVHFGRRVAYNLKASRQPIHLNPFL